MCSVKFVTVYVLLFFLSTFTTNLIVYAFTKGVQIVKDLLISSMYLKESKSLEALGYLAPLSFSSYLHSQH